MVFIREKEKNKKKVFDGVLVSSDWRGGGLLIGGGRLEFLDNKVEN